MIRVCIAGATGWAGSELARAVGRVRGPHSRGCRVAHTHAGANSRRSAQQAWSRHADIRLGRRRSCDSLRRFSRVHQTGQRQSNILAALERRCHVVVGTSGLVEEDFADIEVCCPQTAARSPGVWELCADGCVTPAICRSCGQVIPQWRSSTTRTMPSVTRRVEDSAELAALVSQPSGIRRSPCRWTRRSGPREARGATLSASQVHSVRLPGFCSSASRPFLACRTSA